MEWLLVIGVVVAGSMIVSALFRLWGPNKPDDY